MPFDLSMLELQVILWPLIFGFGMYLLVMAQPIGRPKPNLAERLRRLDVEERLRMDLDRRDVRPLFASRLLEAMLRPILDDCGRLLHLVFQRFGLGGGAELARKLQVTRHGVEPIQFFGEKVASGAIGLGLFPVMDALAIHPFGAWPFWTWLVGFALGFLAPDWELERRLTTRRTLVLMELPILLDMLAIAASAGLALEQALALVARQSQGIVARELQRVVREMAIGQRPVVAALEAMAERNAVPELSSLVGQLRVAHDQGIPLVQTLSTQAEALREQKRLRIMEEGGKASVRMILPVALFILPVLFVVLLVPAAVELLRLGG
jgi:tight adherence protein C